MSATSAQIFRFLWFKPSLPKATDSNHIFFFQWSKEFNAMYNGIGFFSRKIWQLSCNSKIETSPKANRGNHQINISCSLIWQLHPWNIFQKKSISWKAAEQLRRKFFIKNPAVSSFYKSEFKIWAGLGRLGRLGSFKFIFWKVFLFFEITSFCQPKCACCIFH